MGDAGGHAALHALHDFPQSLHHHKRAQQLERYAVLPFVTSSAQRRHHSAHLSPSPPGACCSPELAQVRPGTRRDPSVALPSQSPPLLYPCCARVFATADPPAQGPEIREQPKIDRRAGTGRCQCARRETHRWLSRGILRSPFPYVFDRECRIAAQNGAKTISRDVLNANTLATGITYPFRQSEVDNTELGAGAGSPHEI
jgi:hypothetical protein